MRCCWATGNVNPSDTACLVTRRRGLDFSLPSVNSVRIVARVMIRNNETTRLEIVSNVRRLLRRMFFKINLLNFIRVPPIAFSAIIGSKGLDPAHSSESYSEYPVDTQFQC